MSTFYGSREAEEDRRREEARKDPCYGDNHEFRATGIRTEREGDFEVKYEDYLCSRCPKTATKELSRLEKLSDRAIRQQRKEDRENSEHGEKYGWRSETAG